jgi:hypothetical protein
MIDGAVASALSNVAAGNAYNVGLDCTDAELYHMLCASASDDDDDARLSPAHKSDLERNPQHAH